MRHWLNLPALIRLSTDGSYEEWDPHPWAIQSSPRLQDAINISVRKPELCHQMPMLSTADEGVKSVINTVLKVTGRKRKSEASKRRSSFPKRDVHDGEANGIVRLKQAFMGASNTGKRFDFLVLHGSCRTSVGLELAERAGRHTEFKSGQMLYLVPYDSKFQITRNGKTSIPSQALCILFPDTQSIGQGRDRSAEQSDALPFRGREKTYGHLPVISGETGQKLGELGFNKLNVELIEDVPRQLNIASSYVFRFIHIVERRLYEVCDPHSTITT
nr:MULTISPECIES: hypothetical protein [unclassified Roseobacter]